MQADRAIELIYEASTTPSLWPDALDLIAKCTDDVGAVLLWVRPNGSFGTVCSPSLKEAQIEYERHWWTHDVRARRAVERSAWLEQDVVTDHDLFTMEEIEKEPIYTDFLRTFGLRWVAAVGVSPDPMLHAALTVQRSDGRDPFTTSERDVVLRLGRHVERSLRIGSRLIEAETTVETLGDVLRRMNVAIFTIDDSDHVLFMNESAKNMLDGPLYIKQGRLHVSHRGTDILLQDAFSIRPLLEEKSSDICPLLLFREDGSRMFVFQMPMIVRSELAEKVLRRSEKIVIVTLEGSQSLQDSFVLRELFGLTGAESRLAAIVGQGASPREAAGRLQITEETARSVLKRIYSKTGISRQSQLATLLNSVGLKS